MPFFVWVKGHRGPEPQIVLTDMTNSKGKQAGPAIIQQIPITEADVDLGVEALAVMWPCIEGEL